jgi:hypothetical protein
VAPAYGQLISSADPAIAFIGFLQTMHALPEAEMDFSLPEYFQLLELLLAVRGRWFLRL